MKITIVSALYPPEAIGGAETAAHNLANWLALKGNTVSVLSTATAKSAEFVEDRTRNPSLTRAYFPHIYPIFHFQDAPSWKKPLWHIQDHVDPRNELIFDKYLEITEPDVAIVHYIQGIGYNALKALARRKIPSIFILHDLGLVCIRMSMFKNGSNCVSQCSLCKISTRYKQHIISQIPQVGFCSPSRFNLEATGRIFGFGHRPNTSILNINLYPFPNRPRTRKIGLQILYVGRVHRTKGVDVLLSAASRLVTSCDLHVTIVGDGPDLATLQAEYGEHSWCTFAGQVTHQEVANYMNDADVLCIPSTWMENSPGVAIHALQLGLPILASDIGGIPELVHHEENGLLVTAGDVEAWAHAISGVIQAPGRLLAWRDNARLSAKDLEQESIGAEYLAFIETVLASGKLR